MQRKYARTGLIVFFCTLGLLTTPGWSLIINGGGTNARHNRFTTDFPNNAQPGSLTERTGWIGDGFDWSGVGWDSENANASADVRGWYKNVTLISPQHIIAARHFPVTSPVHFLGSDGVIRTRTISSSHNTFYEGDLTDLRIHRLSSPLPAAYHNPYAIPADVPNKWVNETAYLYGNAVMSSINNGIRKRVGLSTIDASQVISASGSISETIIMAYFTSGPNSNGTDEARAVGGDSGAPSFIDIYGELAVIGTHWLAGTAEDLEGNEYLVSVDVYLPSMIDEMNRILASDGYTVRVIIPEPTSAILLTLTSVALLRRRRRTC